MRIELYQDSKLMEVKEVLDVAGKFFPEVSVEASGPIVVTTQSASDGTFTLSDLPAGIYALRGIKVGYKCDVQNITIGA